MASSLFGSLTSGLGNLFGGSETLNAIGNFGDFALGAYDMYRGFENEGRTNDYLNSLGASYALSDELLRQQAARAKSLYYPIEDKQAAYALEDLQKMRPLQSARQDYALDRGQDKIAFAQNVMDPTEDSLLTFLSKGADSQKYRDAASADIQSSFDQSSSDTQRAMARLGINPNSGAFSDFLKQIQISKGAAEAGARTDASRIAEDLDVSRKSQALNYWKGIPFSTQTVQNSGTTLANTAASGFRDAANQLSNAARLTNSMAGDQFAGATSLFSNLGNYLSPSQQTQSPTNLVYNNPFRYGSSGTQPGTF